MVSGYTHFFLLSQIKKVYHITEQVDSTKPIKPRKARSVNCAGCEIKIDRETDAFIAISKKNYHEKCYNSFQTKKQHRIELLEYICALYSIPVANGFILKQIKEFEEQYFYTLKGIQMTLQYFHQVQGNPVNPTNTKYKTTKGIGIVPHVYDEARDYFIRMQSITTSAQNIVISSTVDVVYVRSTIKKKPKNFIEIKGIADE